MPYRNVTVEGRDDEGIATLSGEQPLGDGDRWVRFTASADLLQIRHAFYGHDEAGWRLWGIQDGMPGVDPDDASWDWSALRDSSPEARRAMREVAREYVPDEQLADMLGIDPAAIA